MSLSLMNKVLQHTLSSWHQRMVHRNLSFFSLNFYGSTNIFKVSSPIESNWLMMCRWVIQVGCLFLPFLEQFLMPSRDYYCRHSFEEGMCKGIYWVKILQSYKRYTCKLSKSIPQLRLYFRPWLLFWSYNYRFLKLAIRQQCSFFATRYRYYPLYWAVAVRR